MSGWTQRWAGRGAAIAAATVLGLSGASATAAQATAAQATAQSALARSTPAPGTQLTGLHACSCQYNGAAVAVSGTTVVFGVPGIDDGAGRLFVYSDAGGEWKQTAQLAGSDTGSGDNFGNAVAMTATTIIVGAPAHAAYAGRVYIFTLSGGRWTQSAELVGSDTAPTDWFGDSVALSGTTAVVGAPEHAGAAGAAYIFSDASGPWAQEAEESGEGVGLGYFGYSVAVDGTQALVGAPGSTGVAGSAYFYSQQGDTWAPEAVVQSPSTGANDDFGNAVTLQGTEAVIAAWKTNHGVAYAFSDSGGSWIDTQTITESDAQGGDDLGASVTLQGSTLVVGGTIDDGNIGVAYVFDTSQNGSWVPAAEVEPAGNDGGDFFSNKSVALDGTTLVVASPGHAGGIDGGSSGSADVYSVSGSTWSSVAKLSAAVSYAHQAFGSSMAFSAGTGVAGAPGYGGGAGRAYLLVPDTTGTYVPTLSMVAGDTVAGDHFGASSAISGQTVAIGAPGHGNGRAYVFSETAGVPYTRGTVRCQPGTFPNGQIAAGECRAWTEDTELVAGDGARGDAFGTSVAVDQSSGYAVVGAPGHGGGRAYVYADQAGSWVQVQELTAPDEGATDNFGASVAVSGTTLVVGATNHGGGRAYVFQLSGANTTETAELAGPDTVHGDMFAASVAIAGDGTVIVGAPGHGTGGEAYVFAANGGGYSQAGEFTGTDTAAGDAFGSSVGIDGSNAVVGAPAHGGSGAAYLFSEGSTWSQIAEPKGSSTSAGDNFGASAAPSGNVALVGEPNGYDNGAAGTGDGYAFEA